MTVKELIELLKECPENMQVMVSDDGEYGDIETVDGKLIEDKVNEVIVL